MPKWKKDAKEFTVSVKYLKRTGIRVYLPKPIAEFLGDPAKITFVIRGKRLLVRTGGEPA